MKDRSRQFKIGLFVLTSLAVLVAALLSFGLRRHFEKHRTLETYQPNNVNGLSVGAAVKLRGVPVGQVTQISFSWIEYPGGNPQCVVIRFQISERVNPTPSSSAGIEKAVQEGLRAIITSEGITGVAYLALEMVDPATNKPLAYDWRPDNLVVPSAQSRLNHIVESIERTLTNLEKLDITRFDRMLATADGTLQRLGEFDARRVSESASEAASAFSEAALEVKSLARDARGTLRSMHADATGQRAGRLLLGLEQSNVRLQRLIDRFSDLDLKDMNEALAGSRDAITHLNEAIEDLQRYPPGFFFGERPPPAEGLEREKP
ncbi:MAG TPA: MlaD family protein [Anaeromyxobacteraceae bacterium]|nr:MlaD family protein [Anaeromyxobacteraceae bacterium]